MNPLRSFLFWCGLEFLWLSGLLWFLTWRAHGSYDPDFDHVVFGFVIGFGAIGTALIAISVIRSGVQSIRQRRPHSV